MILLVYNFKFTFCSISRHSMQLRNCFDCLTAANENADDMAVFPRVALCVPRFNLKSAILFRKHIPAQAGRQAMALNPPAVSSSPEDLTACADGCGSEDRTACRSPWTADFICQWALPDLNREVQIAVSARCVVPKRAGTARGLVDGAVSMEPAPSSPRLFLWRLVKEHVEAGEEFCGYDDASLEDVVGDSNRKPAHITFLSPEYVAHKARFDAVATERPAGLEQKLRVANTDLFRSWVYYHWQWLAKQPKSPMTASFKAWVAEHLDPLTAVEEEVLVKFCPGSAASSSRSRGQLATGKMWQHAQAVPTWFVFIVVFRYSGAMAMLQDTFLQNRGWREALCKLEGTRPDVVTFACCISSCEKASRWQVALVIFSQTPAALRNVVTYGAALSALKRGSCWPEALGVLQMMEEDQVQPNVITFNAAISCCAAGVSAWPSALRLLEEMQEKQLQVDVISCSSAMRACRGAWQRAMEVLEFMHATSMRLDVISCNSAITSCEKSVGISEAWRTALHLLRSMADAKLRPVTNSYNAAISACGGHWQHALLLLQELGPSADAVSYAACICSCGGDHWDLALHLFATLTSTSTADAVAVAAAQSALLRAGKWRHALWLLDEMPQWSLSPQSENLHMAISACDRGNLWPVALALLCFHPTLEGFNAAINAQRGGSTWRQALQLLELAPSLAVQPDLISYSAAMNACTSSWPSALQLLHDLRLREIEGNALTMSSCLRACAMGHQWQVSLCLFEQMLQEDHLTLLAFCDLFQLMSIEKSCRRLRAACAVADDMEAWLLYPAAKWLMATAHGLIEERSATRRLRKCRDVQSAWRLLQALSSSLRLNAFHLGAFVAAVGSSGWREAYAAMEGLRGRTAPGMPWTPMVSVRLSMRSSTRAVGSLAPLLGLVACEAGRKCMWMDILDEFSIASAAKLPGALWFKSLELFASMALHLLRTSEVMIGSVISSVESASTWSTAFELLDLAVSRRLASLISCSLDYAEPIIMAIDYDYNLTY
eukprot:s390_g2.t2